MPIRIKEYFSELKTEHEVWTTTPYRMLRNRTIASCARIAFGVAISEPLTKVKPEIGPMQKRTSPNQLIPQKVGRSKSEVCNRVQVLKDAIGAIKHQQSSMTEAIS